MWFRRALVSGVQVRNAVFLLRVWSIRSTLELVAARGPVALTAQGGDESEMNRRGVDYHAVVAAG
jgi:hypothetical protein